MYTKRKGKKGTSGNMKVFSLEGLVTQVSLELPPALRALCHGHMRGGDYSCHCSALPQDQGQIGGVLASLSLNSIS